MATLDTQAGHIGKGINMGPMMVAFTAPRFAVEHLFIKLTNSPPIAGDYVDVGVAGGHVGC